MLKNISIIVMLLCMDLFAVRLLDKEEALKKMYPKADSFGEAAVQLTPEQVQMLKERLGGQLVHYQKKGDTAISEKTEYLFIYAIQARDTLGVAVIEEQPGKWGPVEFIIAVDHKTAAVQNLAVMAYKEKRGRPIAKKNFLKQFIGKTSKAPLRIRRDIRSISGATVSTDCACFAVRKVILLVELLIN